MARSDVRPFDSADYLKTPAQMAAYLDECLAIAPNDAAFLAKALGQIARAKGMTQVAKETGLSRESLYKALSGKRGPSLDTFLRVAAALGVGLQAKETRAA